MEKQKHIVQIDCECFENNKKLIEKQVSRLALEIIELKKYIKLVEENLFSTQVKFNGLKEEIKRIIDSNKPLLTSFRGWLVQKGFLKDFEDY